MSDVVFNIAKGAVAEKLRDGANLGVLLLKATGLQADASLVDHATVSALLGANTEADFTNYARKTISNASAPVTVDNTNNRVDADVPDQTWVAAGGATNNGLGKLVVYEDVGGADASRVPLTAHDWTPTTDGSDLQAVIAAAGFYRAS